MQLPYLQSNNDVVNMVQTKYRSILNPILALPPLDGTFLTNIVLTTGATTFNHLLGRTPQGWIITDTNASATVYRSQPFNDATLTLTSSGNVTLNLWVF